MQEKNQAQMMANQAYVQPNILQLRLDTSDIIQKLQTFLSGHIQVPNRQPDGSVKLAKQKVGEQLCNDKGVQHLVNYVSGLINPAVVQGNYDADQYQNHVSRIHKSISRQLVVNYHEWDMKQSDLELINDFIMNLVEAFLSRLIDNEERQSYAQTLKSLESSRIEQGGKFASIFGGGS